MPVYEYLCQSCQTKFELLRTFSQADHDTVCPRCQGGQARRLISSFSSFSKGEGGVTTAVGGSSCGSCAASSCASCGSR